MSASFPATFGNRDELHQLVDDLALVLGAPGADIAPLGRDRRGERHHQRDETESGNWGDRVIG